MTLRTSIFGLALTFLLSTASFALPNPASQNCITKGGSLKMRQNVLGQYGICYWIAAGVYSECEEWALFHGQCNQGECGFWEVSVDMNGNQTSQCFSPAQTTPPPAA